MSQTWVVDVVLEDDGNITVSPTTLHAAKDDTIQWQAFGAEAFTVAFRDRGVTEIGSQPSGEVRSKPGGIDPEAKRGKVHELLPQKYTAGPVATGRAAMEGTHPYQVAVFHENQVYMDTGCPEVIIR